MAAWLMTYLLHSTLFLAAAVLLARILGDRWLQHQESLWRMAVVAGLLTATLQVGLGLEPVGGVWSLTQSASSSSSLVVGVGSPSILGTALVEGSAAGGPGSFLSAARFAAAQDLLMGLWIVGALLLLVKLIAGHFGLERRLDGRRAIESGALFDSLQTLARKGGLHRPVRLSVTDNIDVPLAKGWWQPEICLPERVAAELSDEEQESILAHELAHHVRRDPLWLTAMRLLEVAMFLQPLNRFAGRRLQELAEYQSDDWAAWSTGRPVAMARCLASVAAWNLRRERGLAAAALAQGGPGLDRRVSRLLGWRRLSRPRPRPIWLSSGLILLIGVTALAIPGFSVAESGDSALPQSPEPDAPAEPAAPAEPVEPVEFVEWVEPVELAEPEAPPLPVRPAEGVVRDRLEEMQRALELELREVERAMEGEARALEKELRVLERELPRHLERAERVPVERLEALELEVQQKLEKHERRIEELSLQMEEVAQRHLERAETELRRAREELHRSQLELEGAEAEDLEDPENPDEF